MNTDLKKRVKSFLWRGGMVLLVAAFDYIGTNIGVFDLSPEMVTFVGLITGEISKWLNRKAV